jgi:hypothetical protein
MDGQINEPSKGEKANSSPNKYNLRSKKKEGNSDIPANPPEKICLSKMQQTTKKKRKLIIPHQ